MYDIIVVGAGPAGLTAALYALRADKTVLVLEKSTFGGQITFSPQIENYPGYVKMSGNELEYKTVVTEEGEHQAKAVIIATGVRHRQIGLPNEDSLIGSGVSYCAVCDGAFFRDQTVAVLGGGNSALQEAILLSDGCKKVYIIQKFSYFTGEARLVAKLKERDNVEFIPSTVITALLGDKTLTGLLLKSHDGVESELKVDGLFIAIGLVPENTAFADVADINEYGYFDSDESCLTHTPGIFAAGDCRSKLIRQITTAVADGSVAALAACRYIDNM